VRIPKPTHRPAAFLTPAAAIACALALAACGSSTQTGTGSAPSNVPGLEAAQCMRAHGVPNYPDPGGSGPNFIGPSVTGSPAFKGALQACAKFAVGLPGAPKLSASRRRALVAFAGCMRAHGVPSFPDPLLTAPTAPTNGTRIIELHGAVFVLPAGTSLQSPALKQAGAECGVRAAS
jgi:hypothetical protein